MTRPTAVNSRCNSRLALHMPAVRASASSTPGRTGMMNTARYEDRLGVWVGDGHRLLLAVGLALVLAGLFALFLGMAGQFLPHDERFLGMTASDLCALHGCRIVHF